LYGATWSEARSVAEGDPKPRLDVVERWLVYGLLAGFIVFVAVLIFLRDNDNWDRLIYVFSGYEALVFAGAGALWGTELKRREAAAAIDKADKAEEKATNAEQAAAAGRALRAQIAAKLESRQVESRRGARPGAEPEPSAAELDLRELHTLADKLFQ
jgi:hypothetical protein